MPTIPNALQRTRARLAARWLRGHGIEIGALDCPLRLPDSARARYVDHLGATALRRLYPELGERELVEPDVIEDGERLPSFAPASLDFIVANHMLEHCENPLGTLRVHLDRVRPGGVLFYAIPDMRKCFDADRTLTTFEHLVADDADQGRGSRRQHYLEWATHVNGLTDPLAAEENARENMKHAYSIHFHVWDPRSWKRFLESAARCLGDAFAIAHFQTSGPEIIGILRRR
jgi:SAM-dependent methyltransferase